MEEEQYTNGQKLLHNKKLTQASCFSLAEIPMEKRLQWSESFSKPHLRSDRKKLKDSGLFLVLSQNCDIACRNDALDSTVEMVVCKTIKDKDVVAGNTFVKSVRKLQFQVVDTWYEANVDHIVHVDKAELLETFNSIDNLNIINLAKKFTISVPVWRSNRYMRSALPDKFNEQLDQIFKAHIVNIETQALPPQANDDFASYIRALFVWINSFEEQDTYSFELFALLRDDVSNQQASAIQDAIELMAENLAEKSGYDDLSHIYAGREGDTYVSYLTKFVRLNLDNHSLSQGDDDTGFDA